MCTTERNASNFRDLVYMYNNHDALIRIFITMIWLDLVFLNTIS